MAGDWIKMRADLSTHPKVDRLAQRLKIDELTAVGALFCFWAWADKHAVDGRVDAATPRLVDRTVRLDGLADALIEIGWLQVDESGLTIPRFDEHNGESAKERSLKNQRQARWRERKAAGLVGASPSTRASTREEKRREEKEKPNKPKAQAPLLPDWLPRDSWEGFLAMRRKQRKEPTDRAVEMLISTLAKLRAEGHDPGVVLDQSTRNCWIDVFPPREERRLSAVGQARIGGFVA